MIKDIQLTKEHIDKFVTILKWKLSHATIETSSRIEGDKYDENWPLIECQELNKNCLASINQSIEYISIYLSIYIR